MHLAQWMCGDETGAWERADRALDRARKLEHANTICYAGLQDVSLSIWTGKVARAGRVNDEMRRLAEKHDMTLWKNFVAIHDAVLACMTDEPDAAERLDLVLEAYCASGCWLWVTLYLSEQAKALLRAGKLEAAQISVERALREQEKTGERWAEAERRRIEGEILAARGDVDGAQSAFESAISIARAQQSHALAERAAKSAQAHR